MLLARIYRVFEEVILIHQWVIHKIHMELEADEMTQFELQPKGLKVLKSVSCFLQERHETTRLLLHRVTKVAQDFIGMLSITCHSDQIVT